MKLPSLVGRQIASRIALSHHRTSVERAAIRVLQGRLMSVPQFRKGKTETATGRQSRKETLAYLSDRVPYTTSSFRVVWMVLATVTVPLSLVREG